MSTEMPGLPGNDLDSDDDAAFDELARRAGAALRRPAPADGVSVIARRRRRQQAFKASIVGGVAVAAVIGAAVVISDRFDHDRVTPVDSVPATMPTPTAAPLPTTASVPVDSGPATMPTSTAAVPSLWVDVEPGATAPLPPAPLPPEFSHLVWTGTELIVWGGTADAPDDQPPSHASGAAFDPAAGTWRRIAAPPDGVGLGVALWTGTEMAVWSDGTTGTSSAAYDPATDTWRMIANPPTPAWDALWIGDAAVVLGDPNPPGPALAFAYDPATDEWRRLADGPWDPATAVWTGATIIVNTDMDSDGTSLAAYDPATDTWREFEGVDEGWQPVVIPGTGGAAATVAILPRDSGIPGVLLDDHGNAIGELPARPAELAGRCETDPEEPVCMFTNQSGVLVGGEVLYSNVGGSWSLDLEAQTWRANPELDDGDYSGVAAGDLMFTWWGAGDGLVYRAATPG